MQLPTHGLTAAKQSASGPASNSRAKSAPMSSLRTAWKSVLFSARSSGAPSASASSSPLSGTYFSTSSSSSAGGASSAAPASSASSIASSASSFHWMIARSSPPAESTDASPTKLTHMPPSLACAANAP